MNLVVVPVSPKTCFSGRSEPNHAWSKRVQDLGLILQLLRAQQKVYKYKFELLQAFNLNFLVLSSANELPAANQHVNDGPPDNE